MARPTKKGIDYFSFDVDLDSKWDLLEAEYGLEGFALAVKIYQKIYKHCYYWTVTKDELLLMSKRVNVNINLINDIINRLIDREFFNSKIYKKYSILTSSGIQKRYREATKVRTSVTMHKELMLIETPVNVKLTSIKDVNNPQSKVKEIESKNKVKDLCPLFEPAYCLYGNKVSKKDAIKAWDKLTDDEKKLAHDAIPAYVEHKKASGQHMQHFATWLNGQCWENEYEEKTQKQTSLIDNF